MAIVNRVEYIDNLSKIAYWCKSTLDKDSKYFVDHHKSFAAECYENYLKEKIKNPVAASIAMRDVVQRKPIENLGFFSQNVAELERMPHIDKLVKEIAVNEAKNKKTAFLRHELIARNRINAYSVTPRLTGLEKLMFKIKLMF